jgi:hypothetical protein
MAAKTAKSSGGSHRLQDLAKRFRWGEAVVSAIVGYLAPNAVEASGIPQALYNLSPRIKSFEDNLWEDMGGSSNPNNPMNGYGVPLVAKGGAIAGLGKWGHDYVTKGRISDAKLNVGVPFLLGVLLDDVDSPTGGFAGSGGVQWG